MKILNEFINVHERNGFKLLELQRASNYVIVDLS